MGKKKPNTSESELEVLKVLWSQGPSSNRVILEILEDRGSAWAYTTVQTLLQRLAAKGYVKSRKEGMAHIYRACVSRDQLLRDQLRDMADRVCEGSATPLILNLVKGRKFTDEEVAQLRELVEDLETQRRKKGR